MKRIDSLRQIISETSDPYLFYHRKRYEEIVVNLDRYFVEGKQILDVGNSPFSKILSRVYDCNVDEIGFFRDKTKPFGRQFQFDLNDSADESLWRKDIGPYDVIIFAEVIEHLYTSPDQVLRFLYSLLKNDGRIILQTPNAAVLHKRLQLMIGRNPYMLIRKNRKNPGHYREYTRAELIDYAEKNNFIVETARYKNYFDYQYSTAENDQLKKSEIMNLVNLFYTLMPGPLKPGITMVMKKR